MKLTYEHVASLSYVRRALAVDLMFELELRAWLTRVNARRSK